MHDLLTLAFLISITQNGESVLHYAGKNMVFPATAEKCGLPAKQDFLSVCRREEETITGRNYGNYTKDAEGRKGVKASEGSKKTADQEAFARGAESEYDESDPQGSRHDRPSGY